MYRTDTEEALKRVRLDNLKYTDFANYLEIDLHNDVNIASLMQEIDVVHGPMLCWFMLQGYDINAKSIQGQTPKKILEHKLKNFLKQKKEAEQNESPSISPLKIEEKIKKTQEAINILKTVQQLITNNDPCKYFEEISDLDAINPLEYLAASDNGEFNTYITKSQKTYMNMAKMLALHQKSRRAERLNLKKLLKRGGYDKVQIEKNAKTISEKSLSLLCLNDNGIPKLLYHGGLIQENNVFLPLSHCGSFEAAYERLHNTEDDLKQNARMIPLYLKMKSPYRIPDLIEHNLAGYKMLFFYAWLQNEKGPDFIQKAYKKNESKNLYLQQMFYKMELPPQFDYIFNQPMRMKMNDVYDELSLRRIYSWDKSENKEIREKNNRERLIYARMIRYFEQQGYDGFVYSNMNEDVFSDSYICFRREQFLHAADKNIKMKIQTPIYKNEEKLTALEEKQICECTKTHLTPQEAQQYAFGARKFIETARRYSPDNKKRSTSNTITHFWNKIKKFCRT